MAYEIGDILEIHNLGKRIACDITQYKNYHPDLFDDSDTGLMCLTYGVCDLWIRGKDDNNGIIKIGKLSKLEFLIYGIPYEA